MSPSGLVSAATFLIVIPTALIIRLLTLLNLNAVVLYFPSTLSPLASLDNNSALEFDLKDQPTDFLPLWLSHVFQNHNLSQSIPEWEGQNAPVAVSIHFTVNFAQPPVNHSLDQMATIDMTKPIPMIPQNRVLHSAFPSNTTTYLHNKPSYLPGLGDHEHRAPRTEKPFQLAGDVISLHSYTVGMVLICFAIRRQAFRLRSPYRSLLRMVRNSRVTVSSRRHNEHARNQKDFQSFHHEDIVPEGYPRCGFPPTEEASIREWTPEDDYETDVITIAEPDAITLLLQDIVAGFEQPRLLRLAPDPSSCSDALSHLGSIPCDNSDYTLIVAGMSTCRSECENSLSYFKPVSCLSSLQSRPSPGSCHSSLYAKYSELGTSRIMDFCSVDDDQHTPPEVSGSGYFSNAEGSLVQRQPDPPCPAPQEISLIHLLMQPTSQKASTVTCRELVLYSRYPRVWEVDDLVAAWRCFVRSRGGKTWVAYWIIGIITLLEAVLVNFPASGLQKHD